jgi:hypothetical protein
MTLLFFALVQFIWNASVQPPNVDKYVLCASTTRGKCDKTTETTGLEAALDLDVTQTWYVFAKAVNQFGESGPSNVVVVGQPTIIPDIKCQAIDELRKSLELEKRLRKVCGKKCARVK